MKSSHFCLSGGLWQPGTGTVIVDADDKVKGAAAPASAKPVGDGGLSWKARQLQRLQERAEAEVCMCE